MNKPYNVLCYTNANISPPKMTFGQNDTNTAEINFEIYDAESNAMTDIKMAAITVSDINNNEITYGSDDIIITDNNVLFKLPVSAVQVPGQHTAQLYIYGSDYQRITISDFKYTVRAEIINDESIADDDKFPILTALINTLDEKEAERQKTFDNIVETYENMKAVDVSLDLQDRVTELESSKNANQEAIADMQEEIDTIQSIDEGVLNRITTLETNRTSDLQSINSSIDTKLNKTGGTLEGKLTAQNNTDYTTKQIRNIILSTTDAVLANMQNGDIWVKYV